MNSDLEILTTKKSGGCCGAKKALAIAEPHDPALPKIQEITPITKAGEEDKGGCQCCSRSADPAPEDGRSFD
jgi:hypothetical protein